jgi:soluble P-type ATPase
MPSRLGGRARIPIRPSHCPGLRHGKRTQADQAVLTVAHDAGIEGTVDGHVLLVGADRFMRGRVGNVPAWAENARQDFTSKQLTPVFIALDGQLAAVAGVGGRIRPDAKHTIRAFQRRGLRVEILSGDEPGTVLAVGRALGLAPEHCHGGLGPEDKVKAVEHAKREAPVFMVGDGVNDAAALAAATVGIAVQGGAEASLATADVYLGRPGVAALVELFTGATRTLSVIRRCLMVSLGYNVIAASLAVTGVVNALQAAILMPVASFTVLGMALWMRTFASPDEARHVGDLRPASRSPSCLASPRSGPLCAPPARDNSTISRRPPTAFCTMTKQRGGPGRRLACCGLGLAAYSGRLGLVRGFTVAGERIVELARLLTGGACGRRGLRGTFAVRYALRLGLGGFCTRRCHGCHMMCDLRLVRCRLARCRSRKLRRWLGLGRNRGGLGRHRLALADGGGGGDWLRRGYGLGHGRDGRRRRHRGHRPAIRHKPRCMQPKRRGYALDAPTNLIDQCDTGGSTTCEHQDGPQQKQLPAPLALELRHLRQGKRPHEDGQVEIWRGRLGVIGLERGHAGNTNRKVRSREPP